ncbi:MAC/perforin domain-containing protein [Sphingobacterium siyangense]|jgi:hypothetical protein|uniref:MAC/perforin domain-containing protein n=1 Tax=Sphingobacterium siyangense TaxID=459529 RepID=UPI0028ABD3F4|nr:MAC/perforin domain-containing protein [Sphingobacterium siyangense]
MKRINLFYTLIASTLLLTNCKKNEVNRDKLLNNNTEKQAVAADGKWDLLGYGYDVTGEYLHLNSASTLPVLDMDRIEVEQRSKINNPGTIEGGENYFYGSNASKFVEDINIKKTFNVSADIGTKEPQRDGQLYFTGSLGTEGNKQKIKEVYSRESYGRYESLVRIKKIQFTADVTTALLKQYLTPAFKNAILTKSPAELIYLYKTHVLLDISLGGRLLFNYTANISNETTTEKKTSKVEGGLGFFVKKFGINFKTTKTTEELRTNFNESRERQMYLKFYGGTGSGRTVNYDSEGYTSESINISSWQQSISDRNCALIDIQRMVPLYEFIDDPVKKAQVKAAIEQYIKDNQITELGEEPVYSYVKNGGGIHLLSRSNSEGSYWKLEKIGFYALPTQKLNSIPVRWYTTSPTMKDNLYTLGFGDNYWNNLKGIVFYAFRNQESGTVPVYEYTNKDGKDHYYSTEIEGDPYWKNRGVAFYAYPAE